MTTTSTVLRHTNSGERFHTPAPSGDAADVRPVDPIVAIARAQEHLLGIQKSDGYWIGELIVDVTLVADMVIFHHWDGNVDPEWQRRAVNHIFSRQLPDGGWNIYHDGPPEVNATVKAYLALKLAGVPVNDPRLLRARATARNLGGVPRLNTFSKLYLALIGLYPWRHLPTIPCEVLLIGRWFKVNFWDMSNWSRAMLVPLAIINHFRPTRVPTGGITLDELHPDGFHERDLKPHRDPEWFTWRNFFLALDHLNRFAELWADAGIHPFRKRALKRCEQWMLERFEGSDGLGAIFPAMLNSLIALKALGYEESHPQVVRALGELKKLEHHTANTLRIEPCFSPVWDTAIAALCLRESGVDERHPQLVHAARWLMDREIRFRGDWVHKNPAKVEPSGWVFEFNNRWNPDVDDTAMVLLALRLMPGDDPQRRDACMERAVKWLFSFQCRDGGWAAFDKDCTNGILEKVPFADHNAMLDPECADITARILELLGRNGVRGDHPRVRHAIEYLKSQQQPDGSWYGRWGVNYIYGTWQVLRGMAALDHDMSEAWLQKGRDWLESVQLENGGWGETCATYEDPDYKGKGPSSASQTAWALMGVLACGDPDRDSIRRGVEYLCRTQQPDGTWREDAVTGTGFPKVFYLKYDLYRNTWPLLALATYQELANRKPTEAPSEGSFSG